MYCRGNKFEGLYRNLLVLFFVALERSKWFCVNSLSTSAKIMWSHLLPLHNYYSNSITPINNFFSGLVTVAILPHEKRNIKVYYHELLNILVLIFSATCCRVWPIQHLARPVARFELIIFIKQMLAVNWCERGSPFWRPDGRPVSRQFVN